MLCSPYFLTSNKITVSLSGWLFCLCFSYGFWKLLFWSYCRIACNRWLWFFFWCWGWTTYGEFDNDFIKINGAFEVASGLTNPFSILLKQQYKSLPPSMILQKLYELDIMEWSDKSDPGVRHVGPAAEDFYRAFGLGMDNPDYLNDWCRWCCFDSYSSPLWKGTREWKIIDQNW